MSRDKSVGTAKLYGLDRQGLIPGRYRKCYVLQSFPTGSEAHSVFNKMEKGEHSTGVKRPGRQADHSPLSSAGVKNGGNIPPLSVVFMAYRLSN
jgi:hypothetical protein